MRILHINKRYGVIGGMERHVKDLVGWQRARGHQADVLAIEDKPRNQTIIQNGETIYLLPELFTYQAAVISHRFPDMLARLSGRYDILHFQYPFPMAELSYLLGGFFSRTPTIATFQGEVVPKKRFSRPYYFLARLFLSRMKRIIATSPNMAETSVHLQSFKHKLAVIPLGIEPLVQTTTAQASPFPEGVYPKLLFVGRFGRYKGLPYLIEAMADCPGHLVLVGEGPIRLSLEARCRELGLDGRVTFTGFLPEGELGIVFQEAEVFVLPSIDRGESFGYVNLEAMAATTALVTTELGTGTSFVNLHGETGLVVPPKDSRALAAAINQLANSRELIQRYGKAARKRFEQEFTLDKMAERVQGEYDSLVHC